VSALARVEVPAALWRKHRRDEASAESVATIVAAFEADWGVRFDAVDVTASLLERAARLTGVHRLRGFDAVQLASALAAREAASEIDQFACFDQQLRDAAAAEGFALVPAELRSTA
jgi:predicted nucleic acid-binding protein